MRNKLPKDAMILLSFVNMKLRDFYPSLSALCEDLELSADELKERLKEIDYEYDETLNRFV